MILYLETTDNNNKRLDKNEFRIVRIDMGGDWTTF